jgi:toxin ParE1/3/4
LVRPKADQDIEEHAAYLAEVAGLDTGHRFLLAADETFLLLSRNPGIGWRPRLHSVQLQGLRIFSISGFEKVLAFYRPLDGGIEILRVVHGSRNLLQFFRSEGIE